MIRDGTSNLQSGARKCCPSCSKTPDCNVWVFYDSYNTSCVITLGPRCLQRCSKPLASCKMAAKAGAQEPSHTSTKNGMHTQGILKFGHCLSGGSHLHSAPSNTAVSCTQLCDSSDKVKCMPAVMCPQVTERCHARQRAPRCKNYRRQRQLFSGIFVSGYVLNVTGGPALTDYVCDIFPPPSPIPSSKPSWKLPWLLKLGLSPSVEQPRTDSAAFSSSLPARAGAVLFP